MKRLAESLMECESDEQRRERLIKSLNDLSFDYPDVYSMLFVEMKIRELDANDPKKMSEWLSTSDTSNSIVKIHEALILVKSDDMMVKEEYLDNLKHMLCRTIENRTHVEEVVKICYLIEKSPSLKTIHELLKHLVERVKQLPDDDECSTDTDHFWKDYFKQTQVDLSISLDNQSVKQQQQIKNDTRVWEKIKHLHFNPLRDLPNFDLKCFGDNHLEMVAIAHRRSTIIDQTIVDQDMDGAFNKWLNFCKLKRYQWFFNNLNYLEIVLIDEENIENLIAKVNRNTTKENCIKYCVQKKICAETKVMRHRPIKLNNLITALDLDVDLDNMSKYMQYMRMILHYPIPNKNCVIDEQLQKDIITIMDKYLNQLMKILGTVGFLTAESQLGNIINKYLECILLINGNQTFKDHQIDLLCFFEDVLKNKVLHMRRDFD
ncbi:uncharacterized protein LOC132937426 [Metopolophium dirhodum]|uniref:uncharacterized protein LOC132937426 n=1 Tax=Metopolophium dirhodum TaxID=44670 RepID=UPI00298FBB6B|nr:uncharacterized protein LOC132937426 [Metopolophium dirhodum]